MTQHSTIPTFNSASASGLASAPHPESASPSCDRRKIVRKQRVLLTAAIFASLLLLVSGIVVATSTSEPEILQTIRSRVLAIAERFSLAPGMDHFAITENVRSLGDPFSFAVLIGILVITCMILRDWRAAVVSIVAPVLTEVITQAVLKEFITRKYFVQYAFPSGHTAGATSIAMMLCIIVLRSHTRYVDRSGNRARREADGLRAQVLRWLLIIPIIVIAVGFAAAVGAATLVSGTHDLIDVIGGFAIGICVPCYCAVIFLSETKQLSEPAETSRS